MKWHPSGRSQLSLVSYPSWKTIAEREMINKWNVRSELRGQAGIWSVTGTASLLSTHHHIPQHVNQHLQGWLRARRAGAGYRAAFGMKTSSREGVNSTQI